MTITPDRIPELLSPVVAVLRGFSPKRSVALARQAWDLGISAVEVTIHQPDCLPSLEAVACEARRVGRFVGAGSVMNVDQIQLVRQLGVDFTVAPGLDEAVVVESAKAGLVHIPGIATPTEAQRAISLGVPMVKAFPAASLGVQWFRAMRGPFPKLPILATGGIDARNASDFLDAGADSVGVGSALTQPDQLAQLSRIVT